MKEQEPKPGERAARRRDIVDDFNDLSFACAAALDRALRDGARKYAPGEWRRSAMTEHLVHAEGHAKLARGACDRERMRVHLTHLLARAAMAWRLFQEEADRA